MTELPMTVTDYGSQWIKRALSVPTCTESICFCAVDKRIYSPTHATCLHRNCKFIITEEPYLVLLIPRPSENLIMPLFGTRRHRARDRAYVTEERRPRSGWARFYPRRDPDRVAGGYRTYSYAQFPLDRCQPCAHQKVNTPRRRCAR